MPAIGVSDLFTVFELVNRRRTAKKQAVAEWLDAVYTDLEDLAHIWRRLSVAVKTADVQNEAARALAVIGRGEDGLSQQVYAGRLKRFYDAASLVLRHKAGGEIRDAFIDSLGRVLYERLNARTAFDAHLKMGTLDPTNARLHISDMSSAADALQKEVAALQVLIKTFKATSA